MPPSLPSLLKFHSDRGMSSSRERSWLRSELAPAPTHQAAILCHFIEPHHERFGAVEFRQVRNRLEQYLLHGVFRVLALAADPHAKGEHRILEQRQSLLQSGIVAPPQELLQPALSLNALP